MRALEDWLLEWLIRRARRCLLRAPDRAGQEAAWRRMRALVAARSPERVRRMEKARGLDESQRKCT